MPNLAKRPPDPQLRGFLEAYDLHISDLALSLREIVLETTNGGNVPKV
jgi:hypothetical protein